MSDPIKRYRKVRGEPGYSDMMCVRPDGDYVRYADHTATITRLTAERDATLAQSELNASIVMAGFRKMREIADQRDQALARVAAQTTIIREACNLLAIEADAIKDGISICGVMSPGPEDAHTVTATNEIEDLIRRADEAIGKGG